MKRLKEFSLFFLVLIHFSSASPHHNGIPHSEDIVTTETSQILSDGEEISKDDEATTSSATGKNEREGGDITAAAADDNLISESSADVNTAASQDESVDTTTAASNNTPSENIVFLKEPEIGADEYNLKNGIVPEDKESPLFDVSQYEGLTIKTFPNQSDPNNRYYAGRVNSCECGRPGKRIVGGEKTPIQEYPWTVVLYRRRFFWGNLQQYCGGTLINNYYILTASHCVDGMIPSGIEVGVHDETLSVADELESPTQMIKVERIIMHPEYNRRTIDNDIALLKLEEPVTIGQVTVPACLPAGNDYLFEGQNATAAGWGATSSGGSTSDSLMKVHVPVLSNEQCNETKYKGKITPNMLCAGYIEEGQKDSCQGDSGGPLIIENGGRRTLIGVVSWGYGCAEPNSPGVYTRVGRYPQWILQNTVGAEWCSG